MATTEGYFEFQGKRYPYTSRHHYKCQFCDLRATWNAIVRDGSYYSFVCDNHFQAHCQRNKAARFHDPYPGEQYSLTTIGQLLQGLEELKAVYASQGRRHLADE